ncbi:hypothetical protein K2173_023533 [Erythroxylum novogranatense]|uniref:Pentatricopeptide repeat-containing protein n=1 Tax=Erythroxylum novogranatense TaxID=1862640 RepID=A0AAV8TRV1_9ROSI|nr:hypothetical protein K2173_023533 [Erythroxylum novogranatense]
MFSIYNHLIVGLPKPQTLALGHLAFSHHLSHSLASLSIPLDTHSVTDPHCSPQYLPKFVDLSNCSNLPQLNQNFAHIIRTHLLHLYPAPFHWNNILRAYTRLDAPNKALHIYASMCRSGVLPDSYTLPISVKAASQLFAVGTGRQLHSVAIKVGLELNEFCESGFISLYSKSGEFGDAHKVFDGNPSRKLGSWNAIIAGLCHAGRAKEAINMFIEMRKRGFQPDDVTMVSVTSACGSLGDLDLAIQLHKYVFYARTSEKPDILMMNSVIDMYGKCGRMDLACSVFSSMTQKNVSSWTSLIVSYGMHGHTDEAIQCFESMMKAGVRPNYVTFIGVLSACVHGGKVQEGRYYFESMKSVHKIVPQLQHYGCMVDLYGRVGLLQEARRVVEAMPMKANVVIWGSLMGACEKYGDVKMGKWVALNMLELQPWNDGVYVALSNIFASRGLWEEVERVRELLKQRRLAKVPAYSLATPQNFRTFHQKAQLLF